MAEAAEAGKAYAEFPGELLSKSEYKRRLKAAEKEKEVAAKAAEKARSSSQAAQARQAASRSPSFCKG
jgi:lysyl-tRNA synthetase class 2